ncbi:hypothetical protein ACLOJK_012993 [Asimina triloba]
MIMSRQLWKYGGNHHYELMPAKLGVWSQLREYDNNHELRDIQIFRDIRNSREWRYCDYILQGLLGLCISACDVVGWVGPISWGSGIVMSFHSKREFRRESSKAEAVKIKIPKEMNYRKIKEASPKIFKDPIY